MSDPAPSGASRDRLDLDVLATSADAGQVTYSGHLRSECVVTLAAQVNRTEAALAATPPQAEPLAFDLF